MQAQWSTHLGRHLCSHRKHHAEKEERASRSRTAALGVVLPAMFLALAPLPAWAYMDPTASGLLYQILMPIYALVAVGLTVLRKRIGRVTSSVLTWARTGLVRWRARADDRAKG